MSQYVADRPGRQIHLPRPALATALGQLHGLLERYSISLLRISLGLVFLGFGILKFFPGLSPAGDIAAATIERLTFGYIAGDHAVLMTAIVETFIGLTLVTGRLVRLGLVVLTGALVGIMSPLVLFTDQLFPQGPSLLGQYVVKDIVLAAGAMVVAAYALGSRLHTEDDEDRAAPSGQLPAEAG
jgi:uncharacterized membrane protein YphA (DoxX/SURF4 family)